MPEFRFRRKKQNRRTVKNPEETAKQIQEAKKLVKPVLQAPEELIGGKETEDAEEGVAKLEKELDGSPMEKRNSFIREREKFFELLKTKYPEQAISLEVGVVKGEESMNGRTSSADQPNTMVNGRFSEDSSGTSDERDDVRSASISPSSHSQSPPTSSSRLGECLYLRHGKSLRHCPMPSPITLSTIKNLYINTFELSHTLLTSPSVQIYVQDRNTMQWNKLKDTSMVTDHCTLLLADSALSHASSIMTASGNSQADSDINMPLDHLTPKLSPSQHEGHAHSFVANGIDITPTELEPPRKNGLWRSGHTHQVQDLSSLPDNLPLQKNPPSLLPNSYPTPSITSSSTTPSSTATIEVSPSNTKILSKARELQKSVKTIKSEMSNLRRAHTLKMAELNASISHTSQRILAAISVFSQTTGLRKERAGGAVGGAEDIRWERLELSGMEEGYHRCCESMFKNLHFLEHAVEELRVDMVERRCKVVETEINTMTTLLNTVMQSLKDIKGQYQPMEAKIKQVMEGELKVIVREEKFLEEECPRLGDVSLKCEGLMQTLLTMLQVASIQSRRTPHVPHYQSVAEPDRTALMDNIMAIAPNHDHRAESLAAAEELRERKKQLHSENRMRVKEFENLLQMKRQQLHRTAPGVNIETRRAMKLKALYMEDRFKQNRQIPGRKLVGLEKNSRTKGAKEFVRRDSRGSSEEREKGQRLKGKGQSRSQELYLEDESELDAVGDVGRREMFQVKKNWAEPSKKVFLVKGDLLHQGWGRGVASQEGYSQESNHSMPSMLERDREVRQKREQSSQPQSNSQPDYYQPKESVPVNSFGLTPPIKIRRNKKAHSDFEEGKRKSLGMGELPKVARYFDTLERKKHAEKKVSEGQTKGVAKPQRDSPYEGPASLHFVNSSYSGSSTASTGSGGSGVVTRPSCLKSSSLVTTSSNSSVGAEPSQGFTSSGSSAGGMKISPLHQSQAALRKGFSKEGNKSAIPRAHKEQNATSQDVCVLQEKAAVPSRSKKPQIGGFPSRYSTGDYHGGGSSGKSEPLQMPSPTPPSPNRSMISQIPPPNPLKLDSSPKRQARKPLPNGNLKPNKPSLSSNSDDSAHDPEYMNVHSQQDVASKIFDSDTLIVDRQQKGGALDNSSLPKHSIMKIVPQPHVVMSQPEANMRSRQHNMQVRFQTNYSDHVPPGSFKATPHGDQHPPHNVYRVALPTSSSSHVARPSNTTRLSQPAVRTATSQLQQPQHVGKNSKVQFQMNPSSDRPHPKSSIPMRMTKSAQTPHSHTPSDTPLTSYPRSHVDALQRRSASNGRVQQHARVGHAPHPGAHGAGMARTRQGYVGGASHPPHTGYGSGPGIANGNNYNDIMAGSLV